MNGKNEYKGNVVVVCAHNDTTAKAILCQQYGVPPTNVLSRYGEHTCEGVISIRLAETNTYEGGDINDNFSDD